MPSADAQRVAWQQAEAWHPVATASLDVRRGPPGWLPPGAPLECTFIVPQAPPRGTEPRFPCRTGDGERIVVAYGAGRAGVHGEALVARLLWAMGFHTDRVEPVRVACRGCPADPWRFLRGIEPGLPPPAPPATTVRRLEPAVVKRPLERWSGASAGFDVGWPRLLLERAPDPTVARRQGVHRQALALLAAWLRHEGGRTPPPTLACAPDGAPPGACGRPRIVLSDTAPLFGTGERVRLGAWRVATPWQDADACTVRLGAGAGTAPVDAPIAEPARRFLAERLDALSRAQVRDLFTVAGFEGVGGTIDSRNDTPRPVHADDWADVFEARRRALAAHRCPEPPGGGP